MGDERLTKKERKGKKLRLMNIGRIAEAFLDDDQGEAFTDKKFVQITDKRRRMGIKKRYLKDMMKNKKKSVKD